MNSQELRSKLLAKRAAQRSEAERRAQTHDEAKQAVKSMVLLGYNFEDILELATPRVSENYLTDMLKSVGYVRKRKRQPQRLTAFGAPRFLSNIDNMIINKSDDDESSEEEIEQASEQASERVVANGEFATNEVAEEAAEEAAKEVASEPVLEPGMHRAGNNLVHTEISSEALAEEMMTSEAHVSEEDAEMTESRDDRRVEEARDVEMEDEREDTAMSVDAPVEEPTSEAEVESSDALMEEHSDPLGEPAESVEFESVEPAEPVEPAESVESVEESVEPAEPVEPVETADTVEPVERTESVEFVEPPEEPTESVEFVEPVEAIEPAKAIEETAGAADTASAESKSLSERVQAEIKEIKDRQTKIMKHQRLLKIREIATKRTQLTRARQSVNVASAASRVARLERELVEARALMIQSAQKIKEIEEESALLDKEEAALQDAQPAATEAKPVAETEEPKPAAPKFPLPTVAQSPLRMFSSFRMGPMLKPRDWFSPSYNSRFVRDLANRVLCSNELKRGTCRQKNCADIHFHEFEVPGIMVCQYMASRELDEPGFREGLIEAIETHLKEEEVPVEKLVATIIGYRRKRHPTQFLDWEDVPF